jgi:predicted MFS family arabinose efflux permease
LGYGIAAVVGPPLGGWIYDLAQTYTYVLFLGTAISLAGFVVVSLDRQK